MGKVKVGIISVGNIAEAHIGAYLNNPNVEPYAVTNGYMTDVSLKTPTALSFDGLFENEINHFVDCFVNGTECIAPAQDGIDLMKILCGIYESARTGHEVIL